MWSRIGAPAAAQTESLATLAFCGQLANAGGAVEALRCSDEVIASGALDGVLLSTAYFYRGLAHRGVGDFTAAIRDFDHALLLAQVSVFYLERGVTHQARNDLDAAIEDYDRTLWMRPDDAQALSWRGEAYRRKDDLDAALRDFDLAHELDPRRFPLTGPIRMAKERAWDRWKAGDASGALSDAEKAARAAPRDAEIQDLLAHVLASLGKRDSALRAFEAAMRFGGADHAHRYRRVLKDKGYDPGPLHGADPARTRAALIACIRDDCRLLDE